MCSPALGCMPSGAPTACQQALLASLARQGGMHVVEQLLKLLNPHPRSHYAFDFQLRLLEALGGGEASHWTTGAVARAQTRHLRYL